MPVDTLETVLFPKPPQERMVGSIQEQQTVNDAQFRFNRKLSQYQQELYNILHSGYLVRDFQVENLTANKILAGTITTDQLYIHDSHFEINGVLGQIIVKDYQATPVTRVEIGRFAAGTDAGIKIRKADGSILVDLTGLGLNVVIDSNISPTANIDGAKLKDLSILNAKIANATIANAKILSLSADKITLNGTLTVNSSLTAINCTGAGAVVFSSGGDIIMKASAAGDNNFVSFRTSGNSERASLTYNAASNFFQIKTSSSAGMIIDSNGDLNLRGDTTTIGLTSAQKIHLTAKLSSDITPDTNNSYNCGISSAKFANMWTVVDHVGDIEFDNGWRWTEPDKVHKGADPKGGMFLMNDKWEIMMGIDRLGNIFTKGFISPLFDFYPPDIAKIESMESEENYGKPRTVN